MTAALAQSLAESLDPVLFARRLGTIEKPWVADSWQADVLRSDADRTLLLCSRQVGKSTVSAIRALHRALFRPGALVLIASPSMRQSQLLFQEIVRFYRMLGRPVAAEAENTMSLTLENGSKIVALPGDEKTTRGFPAVSLLILDEAARVDDEFYRSIVPTLAVSGGQMIALSTPFGRRGWFWRAATEESLGWRVVSVRADECPRISPVFLEEQRADLGEWMFRQEFGCEFVAAQSAFFDPASIAALVSPQVLPLFGGSSPGRHRVVDVAPVVEVPPATVEVVGDVDVRAAARTAAFRAGGAGRAW